MRPRSPPTAPPASPTRWLRLRVPGLQPGPQRVHAGADREAGLRTRASSAWAAKSATRSSGRERNPFLELEQHRLPVEASTARVNRHAHAPTGGDREQYPLAGVTRGSQPRQPTAPRLFPVFPDRLDEPARSGALLRFGTGDDPARCVVGTGRKDDVGLGTFHRRNPSARPVGVAALHALVGLLGVPRQWEPRGRSTRAGHSNRTPPALATPTRSVAPRSTHPPTAPGRRRRPSATSPGNRRLSRPAPTAERRPAAPLRRGGARRNGRCGGKRPSEGL